jgi:hypothetical protein
VTLSLSINGFRRFEGACCIHLEGSNASLTLTDPWIWRHHLTEDRNPRLCHCENVFQTSNCVHNFRLAYLIYLGICISNLDTYLSRKKREGLRKEYALVSMRVKRVPSCPNSRCKFAPPWWNYNVADKVKRYVHVLCVWCKVNSMFLYCTSYIVRHIFYVFETALFSESAVRERIEMLRQKRSNQLKHSQGWSVTSGIAAEGDVKSACRTAGKYVLMRASWVVCGVFGRSFAEKIVPMSVNLWRRECSCSAFYLQ